ncbi:hypothetical protein BKK79_37095 (plasmid) [Cupriavidus sp. USMAA2-4]|uniref:hypothetical protein n=1 Tax=Cupriavidus sp. USMAA2-4 TaxID=876364 RepID=UPI0008A6E56F|nr:hypothetical protein [Cupriavidus sp. USMAA2-4]AOY97557.1 hypothetical protein BKK79_37095 [Cupriavidus sp. USMAA2-4]
MTADATHPAQSAPTADGLASARAAATPPRHAGWAARWRRQRFFLATVVLPTLLAALYYFGCAADQYESEARFVVRSTQSQLPNAGGGLGQMLGLAGVLNDAQAQSFSVGDYLASHDAVRALHDRLDLVTLFRRPEADALSRLWWAEPSPETLLRYYRRQVTVAFSQDTGITTLRVHAFRPDDARALARWLLTLGEARVNAFNQRAVEDAVRVAAAELKEAEAQVIEAQRALTSFRVGHRDIDPEKTGVGQQTLLGRLEEALAQARAQLAAMRATVDADSPQVVALRDRVAGLEQQLAAQNARLTDAQGTAPRMADYQRLLMKQDFAAKRYAGVATALETARENALKQQLYIVRVVEPNLPVRALYPRGALIVTSLFFSLLVAYAIGWLIVAGVREHAA